jgi:putative nucleotidyltransferase with HDIG domain
LIVATTTQSPDQPAADRLTSGKSGLATGAAAALEAALKARAPGVHASTPLVRQLAVRLGRELNLDAESLALIDVAARIRDVGMIALPDAVVLATAPLSPDEWDLVNRHPVLGEQLIQPLGPVAPAAGIVRAHHERWDGAGYPDGLSGDQIPLVSRIIATCDTFVAIASDRPHRKGMGAEAALELVMEGSGTQFDPGTVEGLTAALTTGSRPQRTAAAPDQRPPRSAPPGVPKQVGSQSLDLESALAEFDVVPVLAPAYEQVILAVSLEHTLGGELVAAVEKDTGLIVAVLRQAQALAGRRSIANVADAVAALGADGVREAVVSLPRTEFPWRTSVLQVLMHRSLVHAQAVARATDRIAREVKLPERDDVLAVALLHDIGKLVLSRGVADYPDPGDRARTPEERVRREQRAWGVDHASLGGLLLRRWGLPEKLATTVAAHHSAEAQLDVATYVRLADMVAHHAQGEPVDGAKMLELAHLCGLSATVLRDILFDLPYSGGSHRRRAERSPLSPRQTTILGLLAEGKHYKAIALELGVTPSTVRTHLHGVYTKLGVADRAQAVLRAVEMGWL